MTGEKERGRGREKEEPRMIEEDDDDDDLSEIQIKQFGDAEATHEIMSLI